MCLVFFRTLSAGLFLPLLLLSMQLLAAPGGPLQAADLFKDLQRQAIEQGNAGWGRWGFDPDRYISWSSHSNRLVPVYTFGVSLEPIYRENSLYRNRLQIERLYGHLPAGTLNPVAEYFDQTQIYGLQQQALEAGKKYIVLIIFDGLDWHSTWAAALGKTGRVSYRAGRGSGLAFQDYRGMPTDYGYMVTSPFANEESLDVDRQTVQVQPPEGGYDPRLGGLTPWDEPLDADYLIAELKDRRHLYTDSASSATSMTCGIKTYNAAINVDIQGRQVTPIAHVLQQQGYSIGVVTSVPFSHATAAAAYAQNVSRHDYQDLSRDMLGLPSSSHPDQALPGADVLLGAGWGENAKANPNQGANFAAGNRYVADADLRAVDHRSGGKYVVAQRTPGYVGSQLLDEAADQAVANQLRLLGVFGVGKGHLPYATADGRFDPVDGKDKAERYTLADVEENPTLADMTRAALRVLETNPKGFWMMIESGDVDWASHSNNLDDMVGAIYGGDAAFQEVIHWAEAGQHLDELAIIVTSDHGHYLVIEQPDQLTK